MGAISALNLRFLWTAQFSDGSEYLQNAEDVSLTDPKRSCFYDIAALEDGSLTLYTDDRIRCRSDIALFQLEGQGHRFLVDLRDGHFEIDGTPIYLHSPIPGATYELLYWRRRRHHFNAQIGQEIEGTQECEYHFGWRREIGFGRGYMDKTIFVV